MNLCQKIKHQTILFSRNSKVRSKVTKIFAQPTLIATMLCLKQDEKAIVAVARIKDPLIGDQLIPFGFKCHKDLIPSDIKPYRLSPKNTISINVEGIRPLKAMIVGYGDDSKEVTEAYKIFLEKAKDLNSQKTINIWLSSDSIFFTQINATNLQSIQRSEFEHFVKVADFGKNVKIQKTSTPLKKSQEIIQIDLADEKDQDLIQGKGINSAGSSNHPIVKIEEDHARPSIHHVKEVVKEIQETAGYSLTQSSMKAFQTKVCRAFDVLYSYLEYRDDSDKSMSKLRICERPDNYFIPTYDRTYESGSFTYIEGLLPVPTKKYVKAMNNIPSKMEELEPTLIISAIVKFAFPNHWITDVTLRGAGGRKSLVNIWNHQNPIANPCEGAFENGLGVSRLRAFLDHAVRICGKLSYDLVVEKALHTSIAKAMHYVRTQLLIKASGRDSSDKESSSLNEEFDFEKDPMDDSTSQRSNDPEDNIRVTRKRSRESQAINNLDKFPEDDESQSSQESFSGESSGKKKFKKKLPSQLEFSIEKKDSLLDSPPMLTQSLTETDSGFGLDKDSSENQEGGFSQKRQYSGIESINKRMKSSIANLRLIQEPEIEIREKNDISESRILSNDLDEKKEKIKKDLFVVLTDAAASSSGLEGNKNDSEVGSVSQFDDEMGSVLNSESGSNINENILDNDLSTKGEKNMADDISNSDEQSNMALTQVLAAIASHEEDSIQEPDKDSTKEQKEKDLEDLLTADPRAALLFIKKHNLMDSFMSKMNENPEN